METWVLFAFASAVFAGITGVLAKIGLKNVDSNLATALRTVVVLIFAWAVVFLVGSQGTISEISNHTLLFLILSGVATGVSWLCYFKAIQIGSVNKVTPIDKSSTILTMILAFIFLGENITWIMLLGMLVMGLGTYMMIQKSPGEQEPETQRRGWIFYASLSAVFAALTSIFGKVGIEDVESNLGTAIRTVVVLIMACSIVFAQKKHREIPRMTRNNWTFIGLSGMATGLSWLCFYHALQNGPASIVVPIDKLSIVFTVAFAYMLLKERLSLRAALGLLLLTAGTLALLL